MANGSTWLSQMNVTLAVSAIPDNSTSVATPMLWGAAALAVIVVATAFGNILLCMAVLTEKRLQNMTNYFLASLAFADLLVAIIVMPLAVVIQIYDGYFPLGAKTCIVWATMDVLLCTASIWHMATISVDRYCSLRFPLRYRRTRTTFFVVAKIAFVWIVSVGICSPLAVAGFINPLNVYRDGQCAVAVPQFVIYGSIFAFYVPLVLMLVSYALTVKTLTQQALWKRRERRRSSQLEAANEHQLAPFALLSRISTKRNQSVKSPSKHRQPDGDYAVDIRPRAFSAAAADRVGLDRRTWKESVEERRLNSKESTMSVLENTLTWHDNPADVQANSDLSSLRHSQATAQVARKNNKDGDGCGDECRRRHTDVYHHNHTPTAECIEGRDTANFRPVDLKTHDDKNDKENEFSIRQSEPKILAGQTSTYSSGLRRREKRQQSFSTKTRRIKRKATRVLGVIFLVFIVLWTPFFVLNILSAVCPPCVQSIEPSVWTVLVWLGWISSFVNPIIYTCFSPAFRSAFKRLLRCRCEHRMSVELRRQKEWNDLLRDHRSRIESESSTSRHRTESLPSAYLRRRTMSH